MATTVRQSRAEGEAQDLDRFAASLDGFMRAIRRSRGRYVASQDDGDDLTLSQYHMLGGLFDAGGSLPVTELAMLAAVKPPTATRMLTCLERDGFVVRERPDTGDQRLVLVRLTDQGRACMARKREEIAERRRAMFASLSPAERRQAAQILSRLAEVIEDYR